MSQSQFPKPWQPLRGSYRRAQDSPRGRFSARDAGDSAAFAAMIQPVVMSAVAWLEYQASQSGGGLRAGEAGAAYVSIFSFAMVCKIAATGLKQYGTSVIHDVGTWLWERFLAPYTRWVIESISELFPGHHRRVRRRDRWNERLRQIPSQSRAEKASGDAGETDETEGADNVAAKRKRHPVTDELVSPDEYDRAVKTLEYAAKQAEIDAEKERAEAEKYLSPQAGPQVAWEPDPESEWDRIRRENSGGPASPYTAYEEQRQQDGPPSAPPNLMGCLVVVLLVAVLAMGGAITWLALRDPVPAPSPAPAPTPVVVPAVNLDSTVAPIKEKLAYDPAKAAVVQRLYGGLSEALTGPAGKRVTDTRVLESVSQAFLSDANAKGGTPIGREIDVAIATHLGIEWGSDAPGEDPGWEYKAFDAADQRKLAEITQAIADAAGAGL